MKKILLSISLFSIAYIHAQVTTVTLTVSKDAPIGYHDGANTANINFGYASQNSAFAIPSVAQSGGINNNNALIDFDLNVIALNACLISAKLNLYALGPYGPSLPGHFGTANETYLERTTQAWQENSVTWNNKPTTTTVNQVTLPQSTNPLQNYLNIDVTNLVQDMLNNPTTSFGFSLRLVNEVVTNGLSFASKDNGNPNKIPQLIITYSPCSSSDVTPIATSVYIPNVFTPNNDGVNDVFKISTENIDNWDCKVYNRWGILITELNGNKNEWKSSEESDGTYFYIFLDKNNNKTEKGFISLFRN